MKLWRIVARLRLDAAWTPPRADHRWTTRRSQVTYAAAEPGLAVAEKLVYLRSVDQLDGFILLEADFAGTIRSLSTRPEGWDAWPHRAAVQHVGDAWASGHETVALRVPSILLPGDHVLLNQEHPDFAVGPVVQHSLDKFTR